MLKISDTHAGNSVVHLAVRGNLTRGNLHNYTYHDVIHFLFLVFDYRCFILIALLPITRPVQSVHNYYDIVIHAE